MAKISGTKEWATINANCVKGCEHNCAYCVDGNTLILMSDFSSKFIRDIEIGDEIVGVSRDKTFNKYVKTIVTDKWKTFKKAYKIVMENETELICSGNHRWFSNRGWKYTIGAIGGKMQRPHLTKNNDIGHIGKIEKKRVETKQYKKGYLFGVIAGDGTLKQYNYDKKRRDINRQYHFRLAMKDQEPVLVTEKYLRTELFVNTNRMLFSMKDRKSQQTTQTLAIRTNKRSDFYTIKKLLNSKKMTKEFYRGFLAGIFDAEGSGGFTSSIIRIFNNDSKILSLIRQSLKKWKFSYVTEKCNSRCASIRITGGLSEYLRFFQLTQPKIIRKINIFGRQLKGGIKISKIVPLKKHRVMYDITTGTENFIANGFVSHNCYARFNAVKRFKTVKQNNWENPIIDWDKVSKRWNKKNGTIMFPTQHDITPKVLDACVEMLHNILYCGNKVLIVSKPHFECVVKLCKELRAYKNNILFRFTIGALDNKILKYWEPNAPSFGERFDSLQYTYYAGYETSVSCEPMLDSNGIVQLFDVLEPFVTDGIWIGMMNNIKQRVEINTDKDKEEVNKIVAGQTKERIFEIYNELKDDPKIRWKESFKSILGLKLPERTGEDK